MKKNPIWPPFLGSRDIDLQLDRVQRFLNLLDNPEKKIENIIHIAGTNGKGSTIAFLRSFLESSGYKVNIYTSPHLVYFNERIRIKGELIDDDELNRYSALCKEIVEKYNLKITFFEGTTVMAIKAFAENKADFNIFETGLGGRLDATNIFMQEKISVITPIALDHQEFLGDSLKKIAGEKAGIINKNSVNFIGKQKLGLNDIFVEKNEKEIHLFDDFAQEIDLPKNLGLEGDHQKDNFILAAKIYKYLTGMEYPTSYKEKLFWQARLQKVKLKNMEDKEIWLDGGHNVAASEVLADFIRKNGIEVVFVGMVKRKDYKGFVQNIVDTGVKVIFIEFNNEDSLKVTNIEGGLKEYFSDFIKGVEYIKNSLKKEKKILICGSLFLAGEIIENML